MLSLIGIIHIKTANSKISTAETKYRKRRRMLETIWFAYNNHSIIYNMPVNISRTHKHTKQITRWFLGRKPLKVTIYVHSWCINKVPKINFWKLYKLYASSQSIKKSWFQVSLANCSLLLSIFLFYSGLFPPLSLPSSLHLLLVFHSTNIT